MRSALLKRLLPVGLLGVFSWAASAQFAFDHIGTGATGSIVTNVPNGSYTFDGGGDDVWSATDNFDFAHYTANGDFDLRVRVESLEFTANWTKAGIMVRETLAPNSRMAFNRVTPILGSGVNDSRFAYRTDSAVAAAGEHEDGTGAPGYPNAWLRLQRVGAVFTAYRSLDGATWTLQGTQDTTTWTGGAMPASLELGLGVARHSGADPLATAQFRDFGSPSNSILVSSNPANTSVAAGTPATFTVSVAGGHDFVAFQWRTNGVPVPGATSRTFVTPPVTVAQDGLLYSVVVSNIYNGTTATSGTAELDVFDFPILSSVGTLGDPNGVYFTFTRAMGPSALNTANYSITQQGSSLTPQLAAGNPLLGVGATPGAGASTLSPIGTAGGVNNFPAAENPTNLIDGSTGSKFLNFGKTNVGLIVRRPAGAAVIQGFRIATANDAPERDPIAISIEGTTAASVEAAAAGATWTTIYSGTTGIGTDPGRQTQGPAITFAGGAAYNTFRILVLDLRNAGTANSVQFSEVQLFNTNGAPVLISGASYFGTGSNVIRLAVSTLTFGATYQGSVGNVQDVSGNMIVPNPSVTNFVHGAGVTGPRGLSMQRYDGSGDFNANIAKINSCTVPNRNNNAIPNFEYGTSPAHNNNGDGNTDNYGAWIHGLFVPPVTGNYVFGISSDDRSELYISTDDKPANKIMVAQQIAWNNDRNFLEGYGPTEVPLAEQGFIGRVSEPIRMIAGRSYYMEGIVAEGGGGDHITVAVQKPGDPQIGTGGNNTPIPRSLFSTNYEVGCPATAFFRTPGPVTAVGTGNQNAGEGQLVDFVAIADGSAPYSYQWYSNGVPVPGATQASLTFRPLRGANNAQFYAVVSNPFSSATTTVAILTVNNDTTAPIVRRAIGDGTFTNITVEFSEPIDVATGTEVSNYTITNALGGVLTVQSASIRNGTNAVLRTDAQTPNTRYWVVVNNIGDAAGVPNSVAANSTVAFTSWLFTPGYALMEVYREPLHLGNAISVVRNNPNYPYYPGKRDYITTTDSRAIFGNDAREHYGARISGHFVPAASQNYTFRLSNDDDGQVNGSLSEYPADAQTIINAVCCNGAFGNTSPAIPLVAGNRYYYEMIWKEGTGGDYGRLSIDGTATIPGALLGVYANPDAVSLVITQQPSSQLRPENGNATLLVGASLSIFDGASRSLAYQWFSNGVAIAGATSPVFITQPLSLSNSGDVYFARITVPGAIKFSSNAVIGVATDVEGPILNSARTDAGFRTIYLNWNEPVLEGAAIEFGNYYLLDQAMNQIGVIGVDYGGSNVVLHLDTTLQESSTYSFEIDYQTDIAGNPTLPVGMPVIDGNGIVVDLKTFVISRGFAKFDSYQGLTVANANDPLQPAILNNPNYPNNPTFSIYSNQVYWPQTSPNVENYAMRWTFWFTAPSSGTYKFEPAHDDGVNIYVATNGIPSSRVSVYHQDCCSGFGAGEGGYTVDMVAGQTFYFEEIVLEAGGGDVAGLSVTLPGGQYIAPITADYISQIVDQSVGTNSNVGIAQQPQDQTIIENQSATFSVVVTNPGPNGVRFQWQVDTGSGFTDIAGGTSASLNTGTRQLSNDGNQYRVKVYVLGKTLVSSAATLHVNPDTVVPTVLAVHAVRKHDAVIVNFSEIMDAATATTLANYSLVDGNNAPVALSNAITVLDGGRSVRIPLEPPATLATSSSYTLHVQNVNDLVALTVVATNVPFQTWVWSHGVVNFEAFLNLSVPDYQNPQPVIDAINSGILPSFEFRTNVANWPQSAPDLNNYGMHIFGVFRAPVSGSYKFEPAHDDSGNLLFSPDTNPANAVLVMDFDCCDGFGSGEPGYTVNLVAGQGYYFDLRVIEAGGGDYAGLAVTLPGGQYLAPIPAAFLETFADPVGASVTITQQPQSKLFFGGAGASLLNETFNSGNGGFTVTTPTAYAGPWTYNSSTGTWQENGQDPGNSQSQNTSHLDSQTLNVTVAGQVVLTFNHRYSFEGGFWDGGKVYVSVNGGAFTAVPGASFLANGYNGTVTPSSSSLLSGQPAFVENSPGFVFIDSVANLGTFSPGATIKVRFTAANDENTAGASLPNWEINSVSLTQGGEQTASFTVGATGVNNQNGTNAQILYQWYRNDGAGWAPILLANSPTYTLAPTAADDGALFRATAEVAGAPSATSSSATLYVGLRLHITRSGNQVTVSWNAPAGYCLQETTSLSGTPVWGPSAVVNGVPFNSGGVMKYYRLTNCP